MNVKLKNRIKNELINKNDHIMIKQFDPRNYRHKGKRLFRHDACWSILL